MTQSSPLATFALFATLLADAAGPLLRRYFRTPLLTETKADLSPVTEADRGAEAVMRALIMQRYPDHGIIGEEMGGHRADAEWVWVLDPIDGTKAFMAGAPTFALGATFLGLGPAADGPVAVAGVPFDIGTTNRSGARDRYWCRLRGRLRRASCQYRR